MPIFITGVCLCVFCVTVLVGSWKTRLKTVAATETGSAFCR